MLIIAIIITLVSLKDPEPKWVYCIMITGKDDARMCFARKSVQHFLQQDYPYKKLLIINHHPHEKVLKDNDNDIMFELKVPKENNSLGDLRNIALQLVPIDSIWTVWDDDDYRIPSYLSILYNQMYASGADVVLFTRRYECNYNTSFVWEMELKTGFVFVFAKQDLRLRYMSKDSMEDTNIISDFKKLKKKIHIFENDPNFYIRLVHSNNTSLYINKEKTEVIKMTNYQSAYIEKEVGIDDSKYILDVINKQFDLNGGSCDFGM